MNEKIKNTAGSGILISCAKNPFVVSFTVENSTYLSIHFLEAIQPTVNKYIKYISS